MLVGLKFDGPVNTIMVMSSGSVYRTTIQVDAIQMSTHNICLYKKVDKKYTGCNLKTTELLDCALIGVCAVIRSNTVYISG